MSRAAKVDESIKPKNVYIAGTDKFKSDCSISWAFKKSSEVYGK